MPRLQRPNGWMDQDATWYGGRPRSRTQCVRLGPSFPSPKRGTAPHFLAHLAHVYCGQTADWIRMPLSMEVGLDPGLTVLYGDPAPPQKGQSPHPILGPCLLWPNGWMDQDATWYGGRPRLSHIVLDGNPAPHRKGHLDGNPAPPQKGAQQPLPTFRLMTIVAKQSPISASPELLLCLFRVIVPIGSLRNVCFYVSKTTNLALSMSVKSTRICIYSMHLRVQPFHLLRNWAWPGAYFLLKERKTNSDLRELL